MEADDADHAEESEELELEPGFHSRDEVINMSKKKEDHRRASQMKQRKEARSRQEEKQKLAHPPSMAQLESTTGH